MSKYKSVLDAAVPRPEDPADVPKALGAIAGAVDQALDAQKRDVDGVVDLVRPEHLAMNAVSAAYGAAWSQGGM